MTRLRNGYTRNVLGDKGMHVSHERPYAERALTVSRAFRCPKAHVFAVSFSADVPDLPVEWGCRRHGTVAGP